LQCQHDHLAVAAAYRHLFRSTASGPCACSDRCVLLAPLFWPPRRRRAGRPWKDSFICRPRFSRQLPTILRAKALRALPAHRFVANGVGDGLRLFLCRSANMASVSSSVPQQAYDNYREILRQERKPARTVSPELQDPGRRAAEQPALRQSTRRDPTTLSDYLSTPQPPLLRGRREQIATGSFNRRGGASSAIS